MPQKAFYRAFDDRRRGSRKLILERLRQYGVFLELLRVCYPEMKALDLGCGRGEWLEYLADLGIDARGVDTDGEMLAACKRRKLLVRLQDVLSALEECPDESVGIVTAFHVVEHIGFSALQQWTQQAL